MRAKFYDKNPREASKPCKTVICKEKYQEAQQQRIGIQCLLQQLGDVTKKHSMCFDRQSDGGQMTPKIKSKLVVSPCKLDSYAEKTKHLNSQSINPESPLFKANRHTLNSPNLHKYDQEDLCLFDKVLLPQALNKTSSQLTKKPISFLGSVAQPSWAQKRAAKLVASEEVQSPSRQFMSPIMRNDKPLHDSNMNKSQQLSPYLSTYVIHSPKAELTIQTKFTKNAVKENEFISITFNSKQLSQSLSGINKPISDNPVGLGNPDSSCALNTALQCLFRLHEFNQALWSRLEQFELCDLEEGSSDFKPFGKPSIVIIYAKLWRQSLCSNNSRPLSNYQLKRQISCRSNLFRKQGVHEDAHECISVLTRLLHEELLSEFNRSPLLSHKTIIHSERQDYIGSVSSNSIVSTYFKGLSEQILICSKCQTEQPRRLENEFFDIILPSLTTSMHLQQLLKQKSMPRFRCKCGSLGGGEAYSTYARLPKCLIIRVENRGATLKVPIERLNLPVGKWWVQNKNSKRDNKATCSLKRGSYELRGAIMQQGTSKEGFGHFWSLVRGVAGNWFRVDDERVLEMSKEKVTEMFEKNGSSQVYVLVYAK